MFLRSSASSLLRACPRPVDHANACPGKRGRVREHAAGCSARVVPGRPAGDRPVSSGRRGKGLFLLIIITVFKCVAGNFPAEGRVRHGIVLNVARSVGIRSAVLPEVGEAP